MSGSVSEKLCRANSTKFISNGCKQTEWGGGGTKEQSEVKITGLIDNLLYRPLFYKKNVCVGNMSYCMTIIHVTCLQHLVLMFLMCCW